MRLVSEHALGVQEASGIAVIANGTYLVVDDEAGIYRCTNEGDPVLLDVGSALSDLEGICVSEDGATAFVLCERDGGIWRFRLSDAELSDGERIGKLPKLGKKKNQGWEGIAFAARGTLSERDELIAVHQKSPRRIGIFDVETLAPRLMLRLPKQVRKRLDDLNDVAIEPRTSHVFILSGKAGYVSSLAVEGEDVTHVETYPIDASKDDVPEGLTFDGEGRLLIVTDGEGMLRELKLRG